LKTINQALQQDCLLTDKVRFDSLALNKQLVLGTWSGLLLDEDSLLDDWTKEGVLVGMQPIIDQHGMG
jgi:ribonuclease HI